MPARRRAATRSSGQRQPRVAASRACTPELGTQTRPAMNATLRSDVRMVTLPVFAVTCAMGSPASRFVKGGRVRQRAED